MNEYIIKGFNIYIDYYIEKEQYEKAKDKLLELIDLLKQTQINNELLKTYLKLGNIYALIKNEKKAIEYFTKGYEISKN